MIIECLLKCEPFDRAIGNEKYEFRPDAKGRLVAEVWNEAHIECFLARSDIYRELKETEAPPPAVEADAPKKDTASTLAPSAGEAASYGSGRLGDYDYEKQGTGYDSGASGHELAGRESAPKQDENAPPKKRKPGRPPKAATSPEPAAA